jgi:hypothetical protein
LRRGEFNGEKQSVQEMVLCPIVNKPPAPEGALILRRLRRR